MQPGPGRALPMGILGFLAGMAILVAIRYLQQLQPYMEPQLGIVLGTALAAAGFIYGMGAFDPQMNVHAHEPAEDEEPHAEEAEEGEASVPARPGTVLGSWLWLISSLTILLLIVIAAFALLPAGPGLKISGDPLADFAAFGVVALQLGELRLEMTQLTLLIVFTIALFLILMVVAGGLGMLFATLNRGVQTVDSVAHTPLQREPFAGPASARAAQMRQALAALLVVAFFVLLDNVAESPPTAEFATISFFLGAAGVFTLSFLLLGALVRAFARQTQWAWLVRALATLLAIGLVLNVVDFALIWLGLSQLPPQTMALLNLVLLLGLVAAGMRSALWYALIAGILLPLFYFVLIGLVVPFAPPLLFGMAAGNALLLTALILRPQFLKDQVGRGAAWAAFQLRRLPNALQ